MEDDPFQDLRRHAGSAHPKGRLCMILSAVEEVIQDRRLGDKEEFPSPTEYFAALMTALSEGGNDLSNMDDVLNLLTMVLPTTPAPPVRAKFKQISSVFVGIGRQLHAEVNEDGSSRSSMLRHLLDCVSYSLLCLDTSAASWAAPSHLQALELLLVHVEDRRPKVRKAAHAALLPVLKKYHGATPAASVVVTRTADVSLAALNEGVKADISRALHVLPFLAEAVPFFPLEKVRAVVASILQAIASSSPVLAAQAFQLLSALVSTNALPPPELEELVNLLVSAHPAASGAPEIASAWASALAASVVSFHASQRAAAIALLPRVVASLVALCESPTPLVASGAVSALGRVLEHCVDAELLQAEAGPEAVQLSEVQGYLASLLEYRFQRNWANILPGLGKLFLRAGSTTALSPLLLAMVALHDALEASPAAAPLGTLSLVEAAVGDAIAALGPDLFLCTVPLEGGSGLSPHRAWILPLLKANARLTPCALAHFRDVMLPLADRLAATPSLLAKTHKVQIWAVLPSYCARPVDLVEVLPSFEASLSKAVKDQELQPAVCMALKTLVGWSPEAAELRPMPVEERAVLASLAKKVMPVLFKLLDKGLPPSQSQVALETLSSLARVADISFIGVLFKTLLQRLLQATLASTQQDRAVLMCDLAIALVPVLDLASIGLLYDAVKPMLSMDDHPTFQKRCYRILHLVCEHHPRFTQETGRLEELLTLLTQSLLTSHVSSRQMRLRCLCSLVATFETATQLEAIPNMLGEVILCTKDANAKARDAAYDLLLAMARATSAATGNVTSFVSMLSAALAAVTPHMRSAAVLSLARLLYVLGPEDDALRAMIPDMLGTVLVLLREQAKEVIKAVVSLIRVAVALCDATLLKPVVPQVVDGLMLWVGETKNRFRATIKLIMKRLCRLYGFEPIASLLPKDDVALVTYLQRMAGRAARKRSGEGKGNANGMSESEEVSDDEESQEDDDEGDVEDDEEDEMASMLSGRKQSVKGSVKGSMRRSTKGSMKSSVRSSGSRGAAHDKADEFLVADHDDDGGVVDLLDKSILGHVKVKAAGGRRAEQMENDDAEDPVQVASDGRIIIPAEKTRDQKRKRGAEAPVVAAAPVSEQKRKKVKVVKRAPGAEYKSKKGAGGDVKKAGAFEPYAYIPLDGKTLASKKKHAAIEQYSGVVGGGNAKGAKGRAKSNANKKR